MAPARASGGAAGWRLAGVQMKDGIFATRTRFGFGVQESGTLRRSRFTGAQVESQRLLRIRGRSRLHQQGLQARLLGRRFLMLRFARRIVFTQFVMSESRLGERCGRLALGAVAAWCSGQRRHQGQHEHGEYPPGRQAPRRAPAL